MAKLDGLNKRASNGPFKGMMRTDIIERMIEKDIAFFIASASGQKGNEIQGLHWDGKFLTYRVPGTSKTDKILWSKLFKSPELGGGKGSGGGADDTKYTESLQCYYCSYVYNVSKGKITGVDYDDLKKAVQYVNASEKLEDCLNKGPITWIEDDIYIKTANKLYDTWRPAGRVYFHRGSRFMDRIYEAKKKCHQKDKQSPEPQAPGSFSNDKWNPGDIWASTLNPSADPLAAFSGNWGQLNDEVLRLAKAKKLLGISLKKVESNNAKIKEFNVPGKPLDAIDFKSAKFGSTGDFFSSADGYVVTSEAEVQFRAFQTTKSWQGEIKGGAAAGGKIGGGNVSFYLKKIYGKNLYPMGDERSTIDYAKTPQFLGEFYDLYKKVNPKTNPNKPTVDMKEFVQGVKNASSPEGFMLAKFLVLRMYDLLFFGSEKKRNEFTDLMFKYAYSSSEQSSYFIKVS